MTSQWNSNTKDRKSSDESSVRQLLREAREKRGRLNASLHKLDKTFSMPGSSKKRVTQSFDVDLEKSDFNSTISKIFGKQSHSPLVNYVFIPMALAGLAAYSIVSIKSPLWRGNAAKMISSSAAQMFKNVGKTISEALPATEKLSKTFEKQGNSLPGVLLQIGSVLAADIVSGYLKRAVLSNNSPK